MWWQRLAREGGPIVWDADFTTLALGACVQLPSGLLLTRASAATVQTGSSTVDTSPLVDQARIGRESDAATRALVVEESRTNQIADARNLGGASWVAGSGYTPGLDYAAGPDGQVLADRAQCTSGGFAPYNYGCAVVAGAYTGSIWARQSTAPGNVQFGINLGVGAGQFAKTGVSAASWARMALTASATTGTTGGLAPQSGQNWTAYGGLAAQALDYVVDFCQFEKGAFATEAIITSGAAATRAGDRLYHPSRSLLVSGGRLSLEYRFRPKGTPAQFAQGFAGAWNWDGSNQAYLRTGTGKFEIMVAGSTFVTTTAPAWNAGDVVDLWIEAGGGQLQTVAKYRVNGGAAITLGTSGAPQAALAGGGAVDLLCIGTSYQTSARVEKIRAYRAGRRPAWAA